MQKSDGIWETEDGKWETKEFIIIFYLFIKRFDSCCKQWRINKQTIKFWLTLNGLGLVKDTLLTKVIFGASVNDYP